MNLKNSRPCGDFRTSYKSDMSMFEDKKGFYLAIAGVLLLLLSPTYLDSYLLSLLIYIGFYAIDALGLNILVGFTGQISVGHAVFFGFGAFAISRLVSWTVAKTSPKAARLRSDGIVTFSGHRGVQGSIIIFSLLFQIAVDPVCFAISNVKAA